MGLGTIPRVEPVCRQNPGNRLLSGNPMGIVARGLELDELGQVQSVGTTVFLKWSLSQ